MKNRLLHTGDKFRSKYKVIGGGDFYGQVLDIPDTSRVSNFLSARRYLRTSPTIKNVFPGCVVVINCEKFIVAEHGTGFYVDPIYKHFKLFEVDKTSPWYTVSRQADPVTGIKEINRILQEDCIFLSTQPKSVIEDSLNIQQQTFVALCNRQVNRNDIVDDKIVTKVDGVLGCWLLEMKEQ